MLTTLTARVLEGSTRSSGARFDAYRVDGTFHIDIDLPGADSAAIDITVDSAALTVRAERRAPEQQAPAHARQIVLSERFDPDRLEARYTDGVLNLSIPVVGGDHPAHEPHPGQADEDVANIADVLRAGDVRTP